MNRIRAVPGSEINNGGMGLPCPNTEKYTSPAPFYPRHELWNNIHRHTPIKTKKFATL
jgi:hypothetical protein